MLLPLMAQNNTNSPYTRFGYGDLGERSFGAVLVTDYVRRNK